MGAVSVKQLRVLPRPSGHIRQCPLPQLSIGRSADSVDPVLSLGEGWGCRGEGTWDSAVSRILSEPGLSDHLEKEQHHLTFLSCHGATARVLGLGRVREQSPEELKREAASLEPFL